MLGAILAIVSLAAYGRYRAAAWRAFDADLLVGLDELQGALVEEVGEAAASPEKPAPLELLGTAARATLEEFRSSGIDAEIRGGQDAEIVLAHTAALAEPAAALFDPATWAALAHAPGAGVRPCGPDRRCAIRTVAPVAGLPSVTVATARRTTGVRGTLESIRRSLVQIGIVGLGLALLGGYWLATRALRPIDLLTTQAGRLAEIPEATSTPRLEILNPDDELGRLAGTFNRLLARLESSTEQLKRFIADAAHELKTPVAVVRAEAELTLSSPRTAEAYRESLSTIAAESARLSQLVGDLTLLAEGQTLALPLERRLVDLSELAHDVRRSLRPVASRRDVRVEIDSDGNVEYRGDERLLRQTFLNLAENAVKFSPPGGRVGIGVSEAPGRLEVRFADDAPTLSPEDRQRVFERFYRTAEARGDGATGSGLGLAIVQWAVGLHGGRVRVEPRSPRGNVFVVELPAAEVKTAEGS